MNKAYRVVFNKAIGVWMAVSEIARGRGKGRAAVKAVGATLVASAALFSAPGAMAQTADSLIHQEESTGPIYIGDNTLGTEVSFSNHDGDNRRLTGVANGQSLTDAANVGQVRNTARQIANALGGGATADLVGTGVAITAPTYRLGVDSTDLTTPTNPDGTQSYHNVGTALGNLNNRIKENGTGIAKLNANTVQYDIDPTTGGKTGTVTLNAGTTAPVALKNVADGAVVENSKDAVNGGQLFDVKNAAEKAVEATKYLSYNADAQADPASATGKDALAVGGASNASGKASTALGAGAGAGGNGSVAVGNNSQAIGTEAIAVGQYASANFASSVAIGTNSSTDAENSVALGADSYADRASTVSVGSTGKERQITNVKAGTADTDAANYGQVKKVQDDLGALAGNAVQYNDASKTSVTLNNGGTSVALKNVADGTDTNDAVNVGQLSAVEKKADDNTKAIGDLSNSAVQYTDASKTAVKLGNDGTPVTVSNVAAGTADNDAVNVKQLKDAGVVGDDGKIANVVTYTDASKTEVQLGNAGTPVALKNVADGATKYDAVNFGQLSDVKTTADQAATDIAAANSLNAANAKATADALGGGAKVDPATGQITKPTYVLSPDPISGHDTYHNVGDALDNLNNNIVSNAEKIDKVGTQLGDLDALAVKYDTDAAGNKLNSVTLNKGGSAVQVKNVADGTDDTDAVNVKQLKAAGVVGDDGKVANVVTYTDASKTEVSFGNTGTPVALKNVKAGTEATDAVNFGQLGATAQSTADALGGGAKVDPVTGQITKPTYVLSPDPISGQDTYHNVGDALSNLNNNIVSNAEKIDKVGTQLGDLDALAVKYDTDAAGNKLNSVTLNKGGSAVQVKNVADGTDDTDAVNVKQLKAAGVVGDDGKLANVVVYDNADKSSVTFNKGGDATRLQNVANGVADSAAVNFSQLNGVGSALGGGAGFNNGVWTGPTYTFLNGDKSTDVGDALSKLDGRVFKLEGGSIGSGGNDKFAGSGNGDTTKKEEAQATGNYATASGANAVASGKSSTATGANAVASAENSVALGADSVADRANTVSVGSAGKERAITNVAEATQATDAVNKAQLDRVDAKVADVQNSIGSLQSQVSQVDTKVNRVGAMSAAMSTMVASAAGLPTDNHMAIGTGVYRGQAALAIGYQRKIGSRATVTIGGSTAGGSEYNVGIGAGYGW